MKILDNSAATYSERFIFNHLPENKDSPELSFAAYLDSEFKPGFRHYYSTPSPYYVFALVLQGELAATKDGEVTSLSTPGNLSFGGSTNWTGYREVTSTSSYIRKCFLLHKTEFAGTLLRTFFPGGSFSGKLEAPEKAERIFDLVKAHFESARSHVDNGYLAGLMVELMFLARNKRDPNSRPAALEKALLYIDKHLSEPELSREEVSYASNVSIRTLARLFHQYLNTSMLEYITGKRLQRVIELLNLPLLRNKEIAASAGFSSVIYMDRVFKKRFGVTPSQYRKNPPSL